MTKTKKEKGRISGLKDDGSPNAYWRRFKERLDNYEKTPISNWTEENVLGHILKRYKDYSGIDFSLSYSGPPTKCKEIYCVKRMIIQLGVSEYETIKQYIDWVFDKELIAKNTSFSSIAFFFTTNLILRFKQYFRKQNKISRASLLPDPYKELCLPLDITTYGDLALAKRAVEQDPDSYKEYLALLDSLKQKGFAIDQLQSLE